jgi:hypothetical protein
MVEVERLRPGYVEVTVVTGRENNVEGTVVAAREDAAPEGTSTTMVVVGLSPVGWMVDVEAVEPEYVDVIVVTTGGRIVKPEGTNTTMVVVGLPLVG